jgi:hypothetical protein
VAMPLAWSNTSVLSIFAIAATKSHACMQDTPSVICTCQICISQAIGIVNPNVIVVNTNRNKATSLLNLGLLAWTWIVSKQVLPRVSTHLVISRARLGERNASLFWLAHFQSWVVTRTQRHAVICGKLKHASIIDYTESGWNVRSMGIVASSSKEYQFCSVVLNERVPSPVAWTIGERPKLSPNVG